MGITRSRVLRSSFVALAIAFSSGALAASYNVTLSGDPIGASVQTFVDGSGNTVYDWYLGGLSSPDNSYPVTVNQGDTINLSINLASAITIPASDPSTFDHTYISIGLTGSNFPAVDTGTSETTSLFNTSGTFDGTTNPGPSGGSSCTTNGQLSSCLVLFSPNYNAITFDQLTSTISVDSMSGSTNVTLDGAYLQIDVVNAPVPEPESYAMMLAGIGLIGAVVRRRNIN